MNVPIRTATQDDAPLLAEVMLLAARSHLEWGLWDITLGRPENECIAYLTRLALTDTCSFTHFSRFTVAQVDGHAAAALCGYDPREGGKPFLREAMKEVAQAMGWSEAEHVAARQRWTPIRTCSASPQLVNAWSLKMARKACWQPGPPV